MKKYLFMFLMCFSLTAIAGTCYTVKHGVKSYWQTNSSSTIVKNCLNKQLDCSAHLLGDGRMFDSE